MNSFKVIWMRLNSIWLIDLKMKSNFDKIKMLSLCSDFPFIINHWKDLRYYMINMKIDKASCAIDNMIKKNCFLNKIWLKLCQNNSKLNFVLTILKAHKNETILFVSHFSEMFICLKRVNRYFTVFLMFITSRSEIFFRKLFSVWYFYMIW